MARGLSMSKKLFFSLNSLKPQKYPGGSLINVTSDDVTGFINISFSQLRLNKSGSVEPIWHPNANKIGYCTQGSALVTLRTPTQAHIFTVIAGEVFFVPKGYIHHIENIGDKEVVINFAFDNTKPQMMRLSKAMNSLSSNVFVATFDAKPEFLEGLKKHQKGDLIKVLSTRNDSKNAVSNQFKFNIAGSNKQIMTKGGYLQLATKNNLAVLDGLSILGFGLNPKGFVEPHWHTNAGELVYIVKGHTRITVLSPDGTVDVLEVKGGEGAFAPASFFHNIENIGDDEVEVIAFFSHAEPDYMGLGEVVGSYSNELLSSVFNVAPNYFDQLIKHETPLVIVPL